MNPDRLEAEFKAKWTQLQGGIQEHWGKLTDDDLTVIEGDSRKLVEKLQERYGMTQEEAEEALGNYKF